MTPARIDHLRERLFAGIDPTTIDACWPWKKYRDRDGYGRCYIMVPGRATLFSVPAHRVAMMIVTESDLAGLSVLHSCDNPPCCNPMHLFPGTQADNIADCVSKGRHAIGVRHPAARVDEQTVRAIRIAHEQGIRVCNLARDFCLSYDHAYQIAKRITWSHVQ